MYGNMGQIGATGYVYFITDEEAIKIGYSRLPHSRLQGLQGSHHRLLRIMDYAPGSLADEARIHARFLNARLPGEWFRSVPELLDFIPEFCCARNMTAAVRRDLSAWSDHKPERVQRCVRALDRMLESLAYDPTQHGLRESAMMTVQSLQLAEDVAKLAAIRALR